MGAVLLAVIGVIYLASSAAFAFERKWLYGVLALCWGIGNLIIAYQSTKP